MKLSQRLISSGVLGSGRVRHCSEWDLSSLAAGSRFTGPFAIRSAEARREKSRQGAFRKAGLLARLPLFIRWNKRG